MCFLLSRMLFGLSVCRAFPFECLQDDNLSTLPGRKILFSTHDHGRLRSKLNAFSALSLA